MQCRQLPLLEKNSTEYMECNFEKMLTFHFQNGIGSTTSVLRLLSGPAQRNTSMPIPADSHSQGSEVSLLSAGVRDGL